MNGSTTQVAAGEEKKEYRRWWFKLPNTLNADPIWAKLTPHLLGVFVRLLTMANASEPVPGDITDSAEDIAFTLRISLEELAPALDELEARSLIVRDEDGLHILRGAVYYDGAGLTYSASPEATRARKRKSRAKEAELKVQGGCHSDTSHSIDEQTGVVEDQNSVRTKVSNPCLQEEVSTTTNYPGDWDDAAGDPPYPLTVEEDDIPLL